MAEISGDNNMQCVIEVNSYEQTNQELVMAALLDDLHNADVWNNQELSDLFISYHVSTLKPQALCAALQKHLNAINNHQSLIQKPNFQGDFFNDLSCVYRQQLLMMETLQSFHTSFTEKLDRINYWKKVSAIFCTAAAATSTAVAAANANHKRPVVAAAAAAASILFGALGNMMHSLLKKNESAVKKHKEIIAVMIIGAKIIIKDLTNIYAVAQRLQFQTESMSEIVGDDVDVGKKMAGWKKSFEELQEQANDYSRDTSWARELVLQTAVKHLG